jgi:hypothetical protein
LRLKRKIKKYHTWANFGNAESFAKEKSQSYKYASARKITDTMHGPTLAMLKALPKKKLASNV